MSDQPKKGFGCCFWGCLFFFFVGLVMVGAVWYGASWVYGNVYALTTDKPVTIPAVAPDSTAYTDAATKLEKFKQGLEGHTTLRLTPEELNQLVVNVPELKDKVHFSIENKILYIRCSLSLDDALKGSAGASWFKGRYLSGKAGVKFIEDKGFVSIEIISFESTEGKPLDPGTIKALNSFHYGESIANDPKIGAAFRELKEVRVEDDAIILVRRPAAVQPPASGGSSSESSGSGSSSSSDGSSSSTETPKKGGGLRGAE
ncbi:MAG: hypothetical protein ACAI35_11870 [Candidatus Methylacidiphilales bacterium]|nr:hypothetical protein [Candidatus Methylacidiphilales bacterium]